MPSFGMAVSDLFGSGGINIGGDVLNSSKKKKTKGNSKKSSKSKKEKTFEAVKSDDDVDFSGLTRKKRVLDKANFQRGKTSPKRDKARGALPPGKRISKDGNIYYEYRKNRSDKVGKDI